MCLPHGVKGCQLNDCGATSQETDRVKAAARGLSKSKDCCFIARPAGSKYQLRQFVRTLPLRDEFALLAVLGWVSMESPLREVAVLAVLEWIPMVLTLLAVLFRVKSEESPMGRREPSENMSRMGQANSRSVLGMEGGRLVLKLCRHKHASSGVILTRSCCCEGYGRKGEYWHIP